jgi:Gpi18-like mannosyltransferase
MSNRTGSQQLSFNSTPIASGDPGTLVVSILLQAVLGLFFGHVYDMRINMATGYLVAAGQNPYIPQDLTAVFHNPAFQGMTSIGYPPPWPLLLGLIYLLSYGWLHNFLIYNLAIKLPIILANIGLAYLVREILRDHHAKPQITRKAWIFLLFNPFLLYATTAWGQFDSLVALMTLAALVMLHRQSWAISSLLLALAISLKPTPVPAVLAVIVYLWGSPWKRLIRYMLILIISLFVFCVLPFFIFRWDVAPILHGWNAQFSVSGGMSLTTLYELIADTYLLPGYWWLLGLIWLPAIFIGTMFMKPGIHGLVVLLKNSLTLVLIFFLTRTWLSEQNIILILPVVLLLVSLGELNKLTLSAVWILPLAFTVFNTSPAQLLFPIAPELMVKLLQWADMHRAIRLVMRMLLVIPWQVAGWWIAAYKPRKVSTTPV